MIQDPHSSLYSASIWDPLAFSFYLLQLQNIADFIRDFMSNSNCLIELVIAVFQSRAWFPFTPVYCVKVSELLTQDFYSHFKNKAHYCLSGHKPFISLPVSLLVFLLLWCSESHFQLLLFSVHVHAIYICYCLQMLLITPVSLLLLSMFCVLLVVPLPPSVIMIHRVRVVNFL